MLYKTARTLHNHLGNSLMMFRKFIKCRIDHFHIRSLDRLSDIGNLLRTLIDQKNDQMHISVIPEDRLGNVFQKGCLTCLWRRYDHSSLALSDRTDQIHDTHGRCTACTLHDKSLIRKDRCHIFKIIPSLSLTRMETVNGRYVEKGTELLSLGLDADISLDDITCL
jgi:hypothetical protein